MKTPVSRSNQIQDDNNGPSPTAHRTVSSRPVMIIIFSSHPGSESPELSRVLGGPEPAGSYEITRAVDLLIYYLHEVILLNPLAFIGHLHGVCRVAEEDLDWERWKLSFYF